MVQMIPRELYVNKGKKEHNQERKKKSKQKKSYANNHWPKTAFFAVVNFVCGGGGGGGLNHEERQHIIYDRYNHDDPFHPWAATEIIDTKHHNNIDGRKGLIEEAKKAKMCTIFRLDFLVQ